MKSEDTQNPNDVLLGMYKEANQMLTDRVKSLTLENTKLKAKLTEMSVCIVKSHYCAFVESSTR